MLLGGSFTTDVSEKGNSGWCLKQYRYFSDDYSPVITGLLIILSLNLSAQENNADKNAPAGMPAKQIKLLAVGNSFSNNSIHSMPDTDGKQQAKQEKWV